MGLKKLFVAKGSGVLRSDKVTDNDTELRFDKVTDNDTVV
jgi:hypothetical protein